MGAMAVELETRLEVQIANARAAWAETAEIIALTSKLCMPAAAYTYMSFSCNNANNSRRAAMAFLMAGPKRNSIRSAHSKAIHTSCGHVEECLLHERPRKQALPQA